MIRTQAHALQQVGKLFCSHAHAVDSEQSQRGNRIIDSEFHSLLKIWGWSIAMFQFSGFSCRSCKDRGCRVRDSTKVLMKGPSLVGVRDKVQELVW